MVVRVFDFNIFFMLDFFYTQKSGSIIFNRYEPAICIQSNRYIQNLNQKIHTKDALVLTCLRARSNLKDAELDHLLCVRKKEVHEAKNPT